MNHILFPPELKDHEKRISPEVINWLSDELGNQQNSSLSKFTDLIFELIAKYEIIDAELAHLACKGGVMTGRLEKVIAIGQSKHPAILAYQGLAYLFMNNFTKAEELILKAIQLISELKSKDIYVSAEISGIQIYFFNARYQFFYGVKILQETFDSLKNQSEGIKIIQSNSSFFQWLRISGAKSLLKLGYTQEAIYTNKRALKLARDDKFFKSFALLGLGQCFDSLGNVKRSIRYYRIALKLAYDIKAYNLISIIFNRLGMIYSWRLNRIQRGESFFTEAVNYADKGEGIWLKEGPSWNLIAIYRVQKQYDLATQAIGTIIESARHGGESKTELIGLLNLSELLEEKGDLEEADKIREAAESLATLIGVELEDYFDVEDVDDEDLEGEDSEVNGFSQGQFINKTEFQNKNVPKDEFDELDINELLTDIDDEFQEDIADILNESEENKPRSTKDGEDIVKKFFRNKFF